MHVCFQSQKNYYKTLKLLSPHLSSVTLLDVQKPFIPPFNDRGFGIKTNVLWPILVMESLEKDFFAAVVKKSLQPCSSHLSAILRDKTQYFQLGSQEYMKVKGRRLMRNETNSTVEKNKSRIGILGEEIKHHF